MPKIPTLHDAVDILKRRIPDSVVPLAPVSRALDEQTNSWPFQRKIAPEVQAQFDHVAMAALSDHANLKLFTPTERRKVRTRIADPRLRKLAAMPPGRPRGGGRVLRTGAGPHSDRVTARTRELVTWIGPKKVEAILEEYKAAGTVPKAETSTLLTDEAARMARELGKHVTEKVLEHYCATGLVPRPADIGVDPA